VKDHREKVTGSDGETRIATRCRLGDRWYQNEVHIDEEGKRTERETWHHVRGNDIEGFKVEWNENQGGTARFETPAVGTEGNATDQPSALESTSSASETQA
jgi:hypothetical protein